MGTSSVAIWPYLPHDLEGVPKPLSWRFSMMPYGRDDPDAKTTGFAAADTPASSNYFLLDMGVPEITSIARTTSPTRSARVGTCTHPRTARRQSEKGAAVASGGADHLEVRGAAERVVTVWPF